jgi:hypothetical protein
VSDQGQVTLEELGQQLRRMGWAYVRAILLRREGSWVLRHLSAVVGFEPPGWEETIWQYEETMLVAECVKASSLPHLLRHQLQTWVDVWGARVIIPKHSDSVSWQRRPSFARNDRALLPRPTHDYRISSGVLTSIHPPTSFQVGLDSAPSFPTVESVWDAFSTGRHSFVAPGQMPSDLAMVRLSSADAWLGPVEITPTHLKVEVQGPRAPGTTLELSGPEGSSIAVVEPGNVPTIPLPDGPPQQGWLWLKRGTEWLDYRAFSDLDDPVWRVQAGVTVDVPVEPSEAIQALISGGEGPQLELKSVMPHDSVSKRKTFKTAAAFANAGGGTILIGVDRDEMTVLGVHGDPTRLRDQMSAMVRSSVEPTPPFRVDCHELDDKQVLALHVSTGPSPPYGLVVDKGSRDRPEYYVRRGASTLPAQPADIREAVTAQVPQGNSPGHLTSVFEEM